jgi:Na+-driven multidrug efflux pump
MGHVIAYDIKRAKLLAAWCMLFTTILGAIVAILLFQFRVTIAMLFTKDEEVIQGCKDIWPKLCYYIFILYIFGINSAILRALGMQWHLAAVIFACLWLGTLPAIVVFAIHRGGGIDAVWNTLPIFYTIMQILLARCYLSADWTKIGKEIREHALESIVELETTPATEETRLLSENN